MVAMFPEEEGEPLLEPGPAEHGEDSPEAEAGHPALLRRIQQLYTKIVFALLLRKIYQDPESVATPPPFCPIEGQKWFDQISSQWESEESRFAVIFFGKIRFLPPCIWNISSMSYRLRG
jgi:hypothetical protein